MFCPQCSNEILSERARFCTRCSFPLAPLSGAFSRLFFDKEPVRESPNHAPLQPTFKAANTAQPLLPQLQSSAVVEMNPQEMKSKESVQPFSITEDSTSLLNKG
jgi:hypothetical protein